MTWIQTIPKSEANPEYRKAIEAQHALYPKEYEADVPGLPNSDGSGIVAAHSLIPTALHHAFATFGVLMSNDLPLNRRQHELIATVVSRTNCTHYCGTSHQEFLRRATGDSQLAATVAHNFHDAPLSESDRVMCEHAEQLTRDATKIQSSDIQRLRDVGFNDQAILQITLIAAWFNYINRVADGLGVGR